MKNAIKWLTLGTLCMSSFVALPSAHAAYLSQTEVVSQQKQIHEGEGVLPEFKKTYPGVESEWEGCECYNFNFLNRKAVVVAPHQAAPGRPWIWRPAFFGAFPSVDKALLADGFHIVFYDLTHLYGSPRSVELGNAFFEMMTRDLHLSPKVTVEGLSRGGYFAFNWAAANPSKVACLYVDAPVCDITSWPGKEKRPDFWKGFLDEWQIKDAPSGAAFSGNALHHLPALAKAKIPIITVCGDSDQIVPYKENMQLFREAYQNAGGVIELILKPGCDHHPHSLEDPERVVDFIKRYQVGYTAKQHIHHRGSLTNAFTRFREEKRGCVAFFGGSITFMKGWKEQIEESLKQRFPDTEFTFVEAGIGSAGSTPHAFRFENDILKQSLPDLMFVEAAVNDDSNGFTAVEQVRAMEGIVRHARKANPTMDLVMLHFVHEPFISLLKKGIEPDVIMNHERVANWYSIPSINLAREVVERMTSGEITWKEFGGVHPSWRGHKIYSAAINHLFDMETYKMTEKTAVLPHELPAKPLDVRNYEKGGFIDVQEAQQLKGFRYVPEWMPSVHKMAQLRPGFHHVPMLEAQHAGDSFQLEFDGKSIGIFCVAGPSAGILEYQIDGGPLRKLDMYTRWSRGLYIPWVYMLDTELEEGHHVLTARMLKGVGTECQIRNFVVNR